MNAAKGEVGWILLLVMPLALLLTRLFAELSVGRFILTLAVVFLLQTLVRDFWLLYQIRQQAAASGVSPKAKQDTLFCLESTVGLSAVIIGLVLLLTNTGGYFEPDFWLWMISLSVVMLLCFWMREFVIQWSPWRIYRDPKHANIIPVWRFRK